MIKWQRFRYIPVLPLGKDGRRVTGSKEHIALSRKAAGEGMVLLKNDGILPLSAHRKIALFGKASADYVKGGGGSGDVTVEYVRNLCDGFEEKQNENKIVVFDELNKFYRENVSEQYKSGKRPGETEEPEIPEDILKRAKAFCDVAVVSICRYSSEGHDRKEENDFYLTAAEQKMVDTVTENFENIIVVLNVGGMVDTSWFMKNERVRGVLLAWQAGMEGAMAEADILCGDVCPSARLTDTFAAKFSDYPSSYNFNESDDYVEYTDDIFVGYRYFETIPGAKEKVNFPFGFGLSYTEFETKLLNAKIENGQIRLDVKVRNIGKCAGKQVVQVYYSAPAGKLDKPAKELVAFAKTDLLSCGEVRNLAINFNVSDMASYDEEIAAYIIEKGEYKIMLGENAAETEAVFTYTVDETAVTEQLKNRCISNALKKKLKADGSYEEVNTFELEPLYDTSDWPEKPQNEYEHIIPDERQIPAVEGRIYLDDIANGNATIEDMLAQMSDAELITLVSGRPDIGVSNVKCIGDMPGYKIPPIPTADGPAGLRLHKEAGVNTTAFPCATMLACTFNTELVYEVGRAGGLELKENNLGMWLTPGMNIHRSPLCGRNFEYFSEDPLVSGKMAAAMVRGIQSQRISACIKHFCCNNKEVNRKFSDSRVSERALREIYLKGFEIAVKEADPWGLMTSYNRVNGRYPSENSELLEGVLREEWGFEGLVTTDWNNAADQYMELISGNNFRMPTGSGKRTLKALELGLITREEIQKNAKVVLEFILKMA